MNKLRAAFIIGGAVLIGTLGYAAFRAVSLESLLVSINFAGNVPNNPIAVEAAYILKCQNGSGAINDVLGSPTWIVPRENGTAVLGLMEAFAVTGNQAHKTGALQALEYLKARQEPDGAWCAQYDETVSTNTRKDPNKTPSHAGSVIMAMYKAMNLGWQDGSHQYYDSAKAGARFIMSCVDNKPGTPNGLVGAGKEYGIGFSSGPDTIGQYRWSDWSWVSDNAYAYLALTCMREWALTSGDYAFARACNAYASGIYAGMTTYMRNPPVWYRVVDGAGQPIAGESTKKDALCYYPQKYDIPLPQYKDTAIADWMVANLQITSPIDNAKKGYGAFMWVDAGSTTVRDRWSQGFSEEAWLALADIPGLTAQNARNQAKNWWENYDNTDGHGQLWDVVNGGIRDWYDPNTQALSDQRFIDTSANCIFVYRGGYDFSFGLPYLNDTQGPAIAHVPLTRVSPLNNVIIATGTMTDATSVRVASMLYYLDVSASTTTVSVNVNAGTSYRFSLSVSPDLSAAKKFFYALQAVDAAGNITRLPAAGFFEASVDYAAKADVGASGGTITLAEGNPYGGHTSITIPSGALSSSQTITVAEVQPADVGITPPVGQFSAGIDYPVVMYQFKPEGLNFSKPATITLLYPDANQDGIVDGTTIKETELAVLWWDPAGRAWVYIGGTVDTLANTVTCPITHFSIYAVGFKAQVTDNDYRPKEKIITPDTVDGINDFANFSATGIDDTVMIYDITGRKVREIKGPSRWDGKDQDGRMVESGIYVYQIKVQGKSKLISGTIVVAK